MTLGASKAEGVRRICVSFKKKVEVVPRSKGKVGKEKTRRDGGWPLRKKGVSFEVFQNGYNSSLNTTVCKKKE